jgi:hypothetical protein
MSFHDTAPPVTDNLQIALRAFTESVVGGRAPAPQKGARNPRKVARASEWVLVFDTETTTDAGQSLRFGSYQVRKGDTLHEAGVFYSPTGLSDYEHSVLAEFAADHDLRIITRDEFAEQVFYGIGYDLRATIIGLNLPFDISRIALRHSSARGDMRGGFSFTLSADKRKPAVQVKHLNQKVS